MISSEEGQGTPESVTSMIAEKYDIGCSIDCQVLSDRANATYLVTVEGGRYVLKVYAPGERSSDDLGYEVDLLLHLARKGVPVAMPVATRDGRFTGLLRTARDDRHAILYTYAPGDPPPWPPDAAYYRPYGRAVAAIHTGLDDFASAYPRAPLDLEHLIEEPMRAILPFLQHRPDDADYLQRRADDLVGRVRPVAGDLEWGACHGDFQGANCHATADGTVTFFDFDCCGAGWRAYDLATFRWAVTMNGADDALWTAFFAGYRDRRSIRAADVDVIPTFVPIRHLWWMGTHVRHRSTWGAAWQGDPYFDRGLAFLRAWSIEHPEAMYSSM